MTEVKRNKIERLKQTMQASEYVKKLQSVDWYHLDDTERFYLKNFGIYNIKLREDLFMLRLRIDAGKITLTALETIAKISEKYHLKIILTSRAQIELHNISAKYIYEIYRLLQKNHIATTQTLTDNFRAIIADPYDGVAHDSLINCYPMIQEIQQRILDNPKWMGTIPRKFNTALIGRVEPLINPWSNDLLFALAQKEDIVGFNIYLGGKNSEVAHSSNIFIEPCDTLKLFEAIALTYHDYGLRGSRSKTRLFHLIQNVGMEQVRVWIEKSFEKPLQDAGVCIMKSSKYVNTTALKEDGLGTVWATKYGECSIENIYKILDKAKKGCMEIRLGLDQNFHLIDAAGVSTKVMKETSSITACAGSKYCPLSLWDIKQDIAHFPIEAFQKYKITLGFSGCLKGCGRHYHTNLGLIGLRTNLYGETEKALRVFLGATQEQEANPSRLLYYSVPLRSINQLFDVVLDDFEHSHYETFEMFSREVLNRYEIGFLQVWYIARQLYVLEASYCVQFFDISEKNNHTMVLLKYIKEVSDSLDMDDYSGLIRKLSHQLWDQKEL